MTSQEAERKTFAELVIWARDEIKSTKSVLRGRDGKEVVIAESSDILHYLFYRHGRIVQQDFIYDLEAIGLLTPRSIHMGGLSGYRHKILIEVHGGVVCSVMSTVPIEIDLVDWDNVDNGDEDSETLEREYDRRIAAAEETMKQYM